MPISEIITTFALNGPRSDAHTFDRPDHVITEPVPIVAWKLIYGGAIPVLLEAPTSRTTVFVALPDGRLMAPEDRTVEDVAEAERVVLARAQQEWNRKQSARPKAVVS